MLKSGIVQGIGHKLDRIYRSYKESNTILYALGLGVSKDPMNLNDLKFTNEHEIDFKVLPSFATCLIEGNNSPKHFQTIPGMPKFNPSLSLHLEQKLAFYQEFRRAGNLATDYTFTDIADKRIGAMITTEVKAYNEEDKSLVFVSHTKVLLRGIGGFGFKGVYNDILRTPPQREADRVILETTSPNQAILFRLSEDLNPFHISPEVAKFGGFERPILHGLCTYGIACRVILREYCQDKPGKMKSIHSKFTSHIFPGETLVNEMWMVEDGLCFRQKVQERGTICSYGFVEFN